MLKGVKYFNISEEEYPEEYERFYKEFDPARFQNIVCKNIKFYY
jgi:hypothetical protein